MARLNTQTSVTERQRSSSPQRTGYNTRSAHTTTAPYLIAPDVTTALQRIRGESGNATTKRKRGRPRRDKGEVQPNKKGKLSCALINDSASASQTSRHTPLYVDRSGSSPVREHTNPANEAGAGTDQESASFHQQTERDNVKGREQNGEASNKELVEGCGEAVEIGEEIDCKDADDKDQDFEGDNEQASTNMSVEYGRGRLPDLEVDSEPDLSGLLPSPAQGGPSSPPAFLSPNARLESLHPRVSSTDAEANPSPRKPITRIPETILTTDNGKPQTDTERIKNQVLVPQKIQAPETSVSGSQSHSREKPSQEIEKTEVSASDMPIELDGANDAISDTAKQGTDYDSSLAVSADIRKAALSTLRPGAMVSSTAMVEVWNCVRSEGDFVFDPLFFSDDSVKRYTLRHKAMGTKGNIFVPIHSSKRNHWYLAVIATQSSSISVYDSLASDNKSISVDSGLLIMLAASLVPERKDWSVRMADCPQQPNGHDCGIYVIANTCYLMAQLPLPEKYDGDAWRLVCQCLFQGSRDNIAFAQLSSLQYKGTGINSITCSLKADSLDDVIPYVSQEAFQNAKLCIDTMQTQQKDPQSSFALIRNILSVIRTLHQNACRHSDSLGDQIQREAIGLENHLKMLEEYSSFVSVSVEPQDFSPETQTALSYIHTAHQTLTKKHAKSGTSLETSERNKARMEIAISMLQEMETILCTQAKSKEQNLRSRIGSWREGFDTARRNLEQLLAGAFK
ncbi:hypothetical protein HO133_000022 [Letharia lupina]|uniref:Ubiquitin-like protease family profile domain-containing protein n=1 Tax=Letharia lupina TaxID=560253 RepID=A0A8H6FLK8_9LECA|nr:uncharacterized protein HO133_000022 [Letharia lupina]KAF6230763.1 hypothetical protein HO133_000022 [Letharia lupina]